MNWDGIRAAIEGYLVANWSMTPIAWENLSYSPTAGEAWIRGKVLKAGSQRETLTGSPESGHRFYGSLMVSIFTPANSGSGEADRILDAVSGVFREKELALADGGRIWFEGKVESFESEETDWFQVNVSFLFEGE